MEKAILWPMLNIISFSKECKASSEYELDEKIKKAAQLAVERLRALDVIPHKLHIEQRGLIYTISPSKIATKIDFIFNYYNLTSPGIDPLCRPKVYIKATSIEELTEKLRNSIWKLLGTKTRDLTHVTGYEINHLQIRNLKNYYEAEYAYKLFIEKTFESLHPQILEGEEK